jgi:hypothetical protein
LRYKSEKLKAAPPYGYLIGFRVFGFRVVLTPEVWLSAMVLVAPLDFLFFVLPFEGEATELKAEFETSGVEGSVP